MLAIVTKGIKFLDAFRDWGTSIGWRAACTWFAHRAKIGLGFREPASIRVKPQWAKYPLIIRLGGSSDIDVFQQIFQFQEYACLRDLPSPKVIVDLGANVGYSSAYFLSCFPTATVVAVEPDPKNYEVCRQNLAPYGARAQVLLGAAWSNRCKLVLSRGTFADGREWATQVRESDGKHDEATVEAWDVPSLLRLTGGENVGLLKVDIEGSELQVFDSSSSIWLSKIQNICIELHGPDCQAGFMKALGDYKYDLGHSGELTICRNLRPKTN